MLLLKIYPKQVFFFGLVMVFSLHVVSAMTDDEDTLYIDDEGSTDLFISGKRKASASRRSLAETTIKFDDKDGDVFVASLERVIGSYDGDEKMVDKIAQAIKTQGINVRTLPCFIFKKAFVSSVRRPLHIAVGKNSPMMVRIVLAAGAQDTIDEKDHENHTALFLAVFHGLEDVAVILIDAGALVTQSYEGNWNILHLAAARGLGKVVNKVCSKLEISDLKKLRELLTQKNEHGDKPIDCARNPINHFNYHDGKFTEIVEVFNKY